MPSNQDDTLLIFRIDCIPCAVPAASVQTIVMPPPQLTQPPGSDRGRPGIFRHAGHIYSVVDLRQRFGIESPRKGTGRLLLHENGVRRHALWVDKVVGLVRSEEGQWAPLPHYLPRSLFHSGFLYSKEIVLCSTLDALLTMHNAEPIRRHMESLRQAEAAAAAKPAIKEQAATRTKTEARRPTTANDGNATQTTTNQQNPASISTGIPEVSAGPESSVDKAKTTPRSRPAAASHPSPRHSTLADKAVRQASNTRRPPPRTPLDESQRPSRSAATRSVSDTVGITTPRTASTPTPQTPTPPLTTTGTTAHSATGHGGSRWLLWSLFSLLLLGGSGLGLYLLLDKPEKEKRKKPQRSLQTVYSQPKPEPPRPIAESKPVTPQSIAPRIAEPVMPPAVSREQASNDDTAAIQIEQDEEGTIKLIIQREHLRVAPEAPRAAPETDEDTAHKPQTDETSPAPLRSFASGEEGEEEALQPDADWPKPASLPEPCDCTHIVVKGDTLWAIAKQYTNNAYNYPELARQSGIRNPHRIYPGNKVRIIVR